MAALLHIHASPSAPLPLADELRSKGIDVIDVEPRDEEVARNARTDVLAAVISADVDAQVGLARAIHRHSPDAHILFLTTPGAEPKLRRDLTFAPRIGSHWSMVRTDDSSPALRRAIEGAERRRTSRAVIGRMNVQLAAVQPRPPLASEEFLAGILEQLSDAVVALDPAGAVITHNAAAKRLFGEPLRKGRPFEIGEGEIELGEKSVDVRMGPVTDERGRRIGTAVVARDVTDRRVRDERRDFLATAISAVSSSLDVNKMLDNLAEIVSRRFAKICTVDLLEGDAIVRHSVAARHPAEALGQELKKFPPSPDASHPTMVAIRTGRSVVRNDLDPAALRNITRSPEHEELVRKLEIRSVLASPLRAGKEPIGALVLARTEPFGADEVQAVEELARNVTAALQNAWLYRTAEEANRAKDEFLATISHELRTPMTSILGWIQLMRIGDLDDKTTLDAMEAIEGSARMQAQLIDDLLDLSRIQMGKLHLQISDVDLGAVLHAALETVRPAARAKNIELTAAVTPGIPPVPADPNRMQQVVWNLLSNAVKFTERGGRISVHLDCSESKVRVRVVDTGHGIDPAFVPFVFERFRQGDSSITRRFGGLGLGLSIVRQIIELHGGTVTAFSEGEGKGSTFTILLPAVAVREMPRPEEPPTQLADLTGVRVLVVDDEPSAAKVIAALLTHAGAKVETRPTVSAALEAIRNDLPDVLVSDLAMPDQGGFELISHIRNVLRISQLRLPAIALTAMGDVETRVRILGAGFQRFETKPVDAHRLTSLVARLAGK